MSLDDLQCPTVITMQLLSSRKLAKVQAMPPPSQAKQIKQAGVRDCDKLAEVLRCHLRKAVETLGTLAIAEAYAPHAEVALEHALRSFVEDATACMRKKDD